MARRAKRHGGDASGFQEKRLRFCRRERKRERRQGSWSLQPSTPLIDFWNVFSLVSVFACDDFFFCFRLSIFLFRLFGFCVNGGDQCGIYRGGCLESRVGPSVFLRAWRSFSQCFDF